MANWAISTYQIEGDKNTLKTIHDIYREFMNKTRPFKEGSCESWFGNLFHAINKPIPKDYYMRGFIEEMELSNDGQLLTINAEEAWGATDFRRMLKKCYPQLTIYYIVEEPGCEVYATNDAEGKYFPERIYIDACNDGNYISDYFNNDDDAEAWVKEHFGISKEEIEKFNDDHEDDDDNFIYWNEYTITNE